MEEKLPRIFIWSFAFIVYLELFRFAQAARSDVEKTNAFNEFVSALSDETDNHPSSVLSSEMIDNQNRTMEANLNDNILAVK